MRPRSAPSRGRALSKGTAYVVNGDSGTVTPIATATNTAGPPIPVGSDPGVIAITPDGKTAYVANRGSGTVTPIATATNTAGPPITVGSLPRCHRDHAGRQDRLRRQRRLGHGDPDRDRHQHRRPADHGRKRAPMPSRSRRTARPPTSPTRTSGTVTPIATATNTAGPPIPVGGYPDAIAITPDGKTAYVANRRLGHGDPDHDRHQHRRPADHGRQPGPLPSRSRRTARPPTSPTPTRAR